MKSISTKIIFIHILLGSFFLSSCNIFSNFRSGKITATSKKSTRQANKSDDPAASETPKSSSPTGDTSDTTPPTVADNSLKIEAVKTTEVVLSWTKATDDISVQSSLQYEVRRSLSNNIFSVEDAEANAVVAKSYTANIDIATLTGLTANTTYYFNVIVKDDAGNKSLYTTIPILTSPTIGNALVGSLPTQSMRSTSQRKTFFDEVNKKHWAFWFDGTQIQYGYSADGVTWTNSSTLAYSNEEYSVSYKKIGTTPYVFIAARNGYDIELRRGILSSTSIAFDSAQIVLDGTSASDNYLRPTIAISAQNHVWVGAVFNTTNHRVKVRKSSNPADGNLSSWEAATTLTEPSAFISNVILAPRANAEMTLIVNGEGQNLSAYLYDGSNWAKSTNGLQTEWFSFSGLNGAINAAATIGTDIYVGGGFTNAAGNPKASYIAKWNGSTWESLGSGLNGAVSSIIAVGNILYVGGNFTDAGGNTDADGIAMWNGSTWSALGTGLNNNIKSIFSFGSNIYVGGQFTDAGGNTDADRIAMWNGTAWSALGSGLNGSVESIVSLGGNIYVGGNFTDAGGNSNADYIARWNGSTWSALGSTPLNAAVVSLAVSGSNLYAGGNFSNAGGDANADSFAVWNGSAWSALGGVFPTGGTVNSIAPLGSNIYVISGTKLLVWDGSSWTTIATIGIVGNLFVVLNNQIYLLMKGQLRRLNGSSFENVIPYATHSIRACVVSGSNIYVSGNFWSLGGNSTANNFAMWNGSSWNALGSGVSSGDAYAMTLSGGNLYATGIFGLPGINDVAMWDGTTWNLVGTDLFGIAGYSIAVSGSNVYVGGFFSDAGLISGRNIVWWNGSSWDNMSGGLNSAVYAIEPVGSDLYVGGGFTDAGGNTDADKIAKWDGTSWSAVGNSLLNGTVYAITTSGSDIYIGGNFTDAGGNANADYIAKWDGTSWTALGAGLDGRVNSLVVAGGDLYAGGNFTLGDGVARWDGSSWHTLTNKPKGAKYVVSNGNGGVNVIGGIGGTGVSSNEGLYLSATNSWLGKAASNLSSVNNPNTGEVYVAYTDMDGIQFRSLSGSTWSSPQSLVAGINLKGTLSINEQTGDLLLTYSEPGVGLKTLSRPATTEVWDTVPKTLFASTYLHDPIAHEILSPKGYGLVFWNILNSTTFDLKSYWTP